MDVKDMNVADRWLIIVNPNAGIKKGIRDWPIISQILTREKIDHETLLTEHRNHAIHLAKSFIEKGYRNIAVVGGDGTLNEVLNGILLQEACPVSEILLGMIPIGTGNDWCRMFNVPFDYEGAIAVLKKKHPFIQDIGKVTYFRNNLPEHRYFLNVAGMGYDALVAKKTNLLKEQGKGGPLTYLYFVFASLFQYKFVDAVIEIDGTNEFKGEIFSMNVGICKYNGGGMMQVPYAIPDDGLMDIILIKKARKWIVIRHTPKLYDGSHVNLPIVKTYRGKSVRIRSTGRIYLEADGESLGHSPLTFEILPKALRVVTGGTSDQAT